ncbi:MAG TPA: hypothetical protein PK341_12725 [Spirochaetota bacterium]|nr:hypothetical protein [Spirochaetota bacterium]
MHYPDLLPDHEQALIGSLTDPDSVRKSDRFPNARLFTKFFEAVRGGRYAVVVVVTDTDPVERDWIITAYITRKISGGTIEWEKK